MLQKGGGMMDVFLKGKIFIFVVLLQLFNLFQCMEAAASPRFFSLPLIKESVVVNGWQYSHQTKPYGVNSPGIPHHAIDYLAEYGDPVLAAADGVAMTSEQPKGGFGRFVLIRHHQTDEQGSHYTSLYAHLSKAANHIKSYSPDQRWNSQYLEWTPVKKGEIIGYVGNDKAEWTHLHFQVGLDNYTGTINFPIDPYDLYKETTESEDAAWYYPPKKPGTVYGQYYTQCGPNYLWETDPPVSRAQNVGEFIDGWKDDGSSQAFFNAYVRYGGPVKLGFPFDNGGTVYVHAWPADDPLHNVLIQDFQNKDPLTRYGTDGQTAFIYNRGGNKCFLVKEGMWGLYKPPKFDLPSKYRLYLHGLFGPHDLGAPLTDEYQEAATRNIVQEFDRGELCFSPYQNEWTITWYNDPIEGWQANQPYRVIPQWEQISTLQKTALISSTVIRNFWAAITGGSSPNSLSLNRYVPMAAPSLDISWQIDSPPVNGAIDLLYSFTGDAPFSQVIASGLSASTSGTFNWTPPDASGDIWINILVFDEDGMIVESEIIEFSSDIPALPTPTPTLTFPTPTPTPTPKSPAPLSGIVTDMSTGRFITNAIISIAGGKSTATNPNGEYEFEALSAGVYDITVSKTGYKAVTFVNVIIMPGQPTVLNVELTTPGLLNIETTDLPPGEVGLPYNPKVRVSGGTSPYFYLIASGNLPSGLFLDNASGNISGTPSLSGTFTFAVGVRDKLGAYAEQQYTIVITDPLVIETDSPLPHGTKGIEYFASLDVSGGIEPYSYLAPETPPFPESSHPYCNYEYRRWTYSVPAAPNDIRITFDARTQLEARYDFIYIQDAQGNHIPGSPFTGTELSGKTVIVPGNYVVITLRSDWTSTAWGFKVTHISPIHPSGSLPPGLFIDSSGNLTGIPTATGAYSFTVYVTDSQGRIAEKQFNLELFDPLTIMTDKLNDGVIDQVYNQKLETSGGEGQIRWEVFSGLLPMGLVLDSQSGMLLGTPLEETYGSIVISVSDEKGRKIYKDFTLKVASPLRLEMTALPNALVNEKYTELVRIQGGWAPYTFTILEGELPDGLRLDPITGIIDGIPLSPQLKNFSVNVTDSSYPATQSVMQVLNIRITGDLTITSSAVLPNAKKNVAVNPVVLEAKGGPSPYRWSLINGYLPDGVLLTEQGQLSGTPSSKGDYVFSIQTLDEAGTTAQKEFYWHVSDDLTILTFTLPDAAKDQPYRFALEAKGGIPPYRWRFKSGTLPDGLEFITSGVIQGSPTSRQTFLFTVEVNDSDSPAQTTQQTYLVDVRDTLFIATRNIPNARVNEAYRTPIRAELGVPPYSWTIDSGVPPPGVELISSLTEARLEGTPTEPGTYTFTVRVDDSGAPAQTSSFEYTMDVYGKVQINTAALKSAYVGVPYSSNILAIGGQLPYVWKIIDGKLPNGLQLNQSTGNISGITTLGIGQSSEFMVRVTDSGVPSGFAEAQYTIKVIEGIEIITFSIPKAIQNVPVNIVIEGQGGISPYSWSIASGYLPPGISLDPTHGILTGIPSDFGLFEFVIQMMDSSNPQYTATRAYSWEIFENPNPPVDPTPTPTPIAAPSHNEIDLRNLSINPVNGFTPASSVQYGAIPSDNAVPDLTDGEGLIVTLNAGEGVFLQLNQTINVSEDLSELSVSARSTSDAVQMALAAIAAPVDGSIGYVNPINSAVPVNEWGQMKLLYDSPTNQIIPALQFVMPADAVSGNQATVFVDHLYVDPYVEPSSFSIPMVVDATFNSLTTDLSGLNINAFLPPGQTPGFVSLTGGYSGQGVRLELLPHQLAAHIALFTAESQIQSMILGNVMVKRESGDDGMLGLVITDGDQTAANFLKANHLPLGDYRKIQVGGFFGSTNANMPPIFVIQYGGPSVAGSVVLDNVELFAQ